MSSAVLAPAAAAASVLLMSGGSVSPSVSAARIAFNFDDPALLNAVNDQLDSSGLCHCIFGLIGWLIGQWVETGLKSTRSIQKHKASDGASLTHQVCAIAFGLIGWLIDLLIGWMDCCTRNRYFQLPMSIRRKAGII